MAPITIQTFVNGLEALEVTGVNRRYIHGPPDQSTNLPDLPALFIAYPQIANVGKLVFGEQGGTGTLQAQLYILVGPVASNYQARNFDNTVEMADSLETALVAAGCAIGGALEWSIRVTNFAVAGEMYWAVIADIEGGRWA